MMKHLEDDLLMSAVRWFDYQYPLLRHKLHHSPGEGSRTRKVNKSGVVYSPEATRLRKKGTRAGFPDLFLFHPVKGFHGMAIEMKAGKGKLTEAQTEWLDQLSQDNYFTAVCRSLDEFMEITQKYLR